jgi:hypothetical protein
VARQITDLSYDGEVVARLEIIMKTDRFTLLFPVLRLLGGTASPAPAATAPATGLDKVILPDGTSFPFWDRSADNRP